MTMSNPAIRFKSITVTTDCYQQIQACRELLCNRLGFNPSTKQTIEMIVKYHNENYTEEALKNAAG